ncbi:unnamed protein product [Arabidopsis thaliana]|uniref:Transmembrane protein n=1 Tax=Arabidopsis thaliana TaxID=3702 RepID=A0A654FY67_ARATH|nr:unnamed protein product [Arabidopsis thaliana]
MSMDVKLALQEMNKIPELKNLESGLWRKQLNECKQQYSPLSIEKRAGEHITTTGPSISLLGLVWFFINLALMWLLFNLLLIN